MAEMIQEQLELAEQQELTMDPELRNQLIEQYDQSLGEATKEGATDMAEYYKEKAAALREAHNQKQLEYWQNKKQAILEEKQQREQEWRMDKAVHGAPDYAGHGGWRESEYLYEAEKEYSKNGESAEFDRLMKGAAKAHVREKYRDILE